MSTKQESVIMYAILILVAIAAGAISFSHVHTFTILNSPAGTPGWYGWANAVISELVPIGAGVRIKRNQKIGKSTKLPMALFLAGIAFSVIANIAVAVQTPAGWLVSAFASLMLMGLGKLILSDSSKPAVADSATSNATPLPSASLPVVPAQEPLPIADPEPVAEPISKPADQQPASRKPRTRKHIVPAHPEKVADPEPVAEIVARADALKSELGTWSKVAAEIGISVRTLQNYRKAVAA